MKKKYKIDIDSSDLDALRQFFAEHEDYYPYEISAKYGIPITTVRRWKRKISGERFSSRNTQHFTVHKKECEVEIIDNPDIWDNREWFQEMYVEKQVGADTIAKMIDRSKPVVYKRLKRYGIERRDHKSATESKNKFYDKDWLYENYYRKNKSLRELAKIAKVSPYTISNWLISFGYLPRSSAEQNIKEAVARRVEKWSKRTEN